MELSKRDPLEQLRYRALILSLEVATLAAMIMTMLHFFNRNTHFISLTIPPLSVIVCLSLIIYLDRQPQKVYLVTKITLAWGAFMLLFPLYFFLLEALLIPEKQLVDTLPPISSGIFLMTTSMAVLLYRKDAIKTVLLFWAMEALPVLAYFMFHLQELEKARGMDIFFTLVPAMGMNFGLILFYTNLQETTHRLYIERLQLKEMSEKDALTGAFNRGEGERILQNLINQARVEVGVILFDIDNFKRVNDNFGHLRGDRVLQEITQICSIHLRKHDTLIRWGGEEFLVIVKGENLNQLQELAERLRSAIAGHEVSVVGKVTASFGIAHHQPQDSLRQLFKRADEALYRAKNQGRNQVVNG
jgi:diguanylate cyclase (GGDEF)-like protein